MASFMKLHESHVTQSMWVSFRSINFVMEYVGIFFVWLLLFRIDHTKIEHIFNPIGTKFSSKFVFTHKKAHINT